MTEFECHLTTEPLFDEDLRKHFAKICHQHDFKPATLLMQKNRDDTPTRSDKDAFCTSRDHSYSLLHARATDLKRCLARAGFKVWRMKIEATLFDERYAP